MNKNTKIAKQLVKIAKDLIAGSFYDKINGMDVEKKYFINLEPYPQNNKVNVQIKIEGGLSDELKEEFCQYLVWGFKKNFSDMKYNKNIVTFTIILGQFSKKNDILSEIKKWIENYKGFKLANASELNRQIEEILDMIPQHEYDEQDDNDDAAGSKKKYFADNDGMGGSFCTIYVRKENEDEKDEIVKICKKHLPDDTPLGNVVDVYDDSDYYMICFPSSSLKDRKTDQILRSLNNNGFQMVENLKQL